MDRFIWKKNAIFPWTKATVIVLGYVGERPDFFYDMISPETRVKDPEILSAIGKESPNFGVLGGRGRDLIIGELKDPVNSDHKIPIVTSLPIWKNFEKIRLKLLGGNVNA